ncbi:DinB family protein [Hymenobacter sp. 5516J-16]|nr:DinB family protein [Hymenobacter sp. 5516J-16]UOQ77462.1 DinB family protein [Hymenobacter sp. 5516J-16]
MSHLTTRPGADQYAPYYATYIRLVPEGHSPLQQLREQPATLQQLLHGLTDEQARLRYAPGKWSIKESLVHVLDTERIFAYRALRIARGDQQPCRASTRTPTCPPPVPTRGRWRIFCGNTMPCVPLP